VNDEFLMLNEKRKKPRSGLVIVAEHIPERILPRGGCGTPSVNFYLKLKNENAFFF